MATKNEAEASSYGSSTSNNDSGKSSSVGSDHRQALRMPLLPSFKALAMRMQQKVSEQLPNSPCPQLQPDEFMAAVDSVVIDLSGLPARARQQLYTEYLAAAQQVAPTLRQRGQRIGSQLLTSMVDPSMLPSDVHYSDAIPSDQQQQMQQQRDGGGSVAEAAAAAAQHDLPGTVSRLLDPLLSPVMEPFVEGLCQPFNRTYIAYQQQTTAMLLLTAVAAGLGGFLLGRALGRADGGGGGSKP